VRRRRSGCRRRNKRPFMNYPRIKFLGRRRPPTHPPDRPYRVHYYNLNKMYYLSLGCALTLGVFIQLLNLLQERTRRVEILPRRCKSAARRRRISSPSKVAKIILKERIRNESVRGPGDAAAAALSSLRDLILKHTLAASPENLFSQINYSRRF
jgi:hypothetical protein